MTFEILTIGFTQTTAERFFGRLRDARVARVLDIRLRNESQLAAFAKAGDLPYFLRELVGTAYEHDLRLAPDEALLAEVRRGALPFETFQTRYRALMASRGVPEALDRGAFVRQRTALLCSEARADACHRSVLAAMLSEAWGAEIRHL